MRLPVLTLLPVCASHAMLSQRIDDAFMQAELVSRRLAERRELLDFFSTVKHQMEEQFKPSGDISGPSPAKQSTTTSWSATGGSLYGHDRTQPLGQSLSCPSLPQGHGSGRKPLAQTLRMGGRQASGMCIGRGGLQPSMLRRASNLEANLVSNYRTIQNHRDFLDKYPPHLRGIIDSTTRAYAPSDVSAPQKKPSMPERMAKVEEDAKRNAEELASRRETLNFFLLQDKQKIGAAPQATKADDEEPPAFSCGPGPPGAPRSLAERADSVRAQALWNARTLSTQRKVLDRIQNPSSCMDDSSDSHEVTLEPQAGDDYSEGVAPPLDLNGSIQSRIRSFEQRAKWNADTLAKRRTFLGEMRRLADSGAAAGDKQASSGWQDSTTKRSQRALKIQYSTQLPSQKLQFSLSPS